MDDAFAINMDDSLAINMDDSFAMRPSDPEPVTENPNTLAKLPNELKLMIVDFLNIEPDSSSSDQTVQRRRNMSKLCRVCKVWKDIARPELYKMVHISTDTCLRLFIGTINFDKKSAELVQGLFLAFNLCGEYLSGPKNHNLCCSLYEVLALTRKLKLLSLDLTECNCCFRISSPDDFANGTIGTCKLQPIDYLSLRVKASSIDFFG
jgi:hypothetical protein